MKCAHCGQQRLAGIHAAALSVGGHAFLPRMGLPPQPVPATVPPTHAAPAAETTTANTEAPMATKSTTARKRTDRKYTTTNRTMSPGTQARTAAMNACSPVVTQGELVAELAAEGENLTRTSVGFILNGGWYNEAMVRVFCRLTKTRPSKVWPEFVDERGNVREGVKRGAARA